jgi:hypothetical protein
MAIEHLSNFGEWTYTELILGLPKCILISSRLGLGSIRAPIFTSSSSVCLLRERNTSLQTKSHKLWQLAEERICSKHAFPSNYNQVSTLHLAVFHIVFPAVWHNTKRAGSFAVSICPPASQGVHLHFKKVQDYTRKLTQGINHAGRRGVCMDARYVLVRKQEFQGRTPEAQYKPCKSKK